MPFVVLATIDFARNARVLPPLMALTVLFCSVLFCSVGKPAILLYTINGKHEIHACQRRHIFYLSGDKIKCPAPVFEVSMRVSGEDVSYSTAVRGACVRVDHAQEISLIYNTLCLMYTFVCSAGLRFYRPLTSRDFWRHRTSGALLWKLG